MTDHDRFLELAAVSIDFELAPAEQAELEAHLAGCGSCRDAIAELAAQPGLLAALPTTDAPERVRRTVLAAAAEATARAVRSSGRDRPGRRSPGLLAVQIALVAALAVAPLGLAILVLRDLSLGPPGAASGGGAPTGPPGSIAWEPVVIASPEGTPEPSGDALEPSPGASGAPAASFEPGAEPSGAPSEAPETSAPSISLMAVTMTSDRIIAVGHTCGVEPGVELVTCGPAAVVVDDGGASSRTFSIGGDEAMPDGSAPGMRGVAPVAGGYLAVGARGVNGRAHAAVWRSVDGLDWQRVAYTPDFADAWMNAVAVLDDGSLVAVGGALAATGISAAAWTSADGVSWNRVPDAPTLAAGPDGTIRAGRPEAGMWDVDLVGDDLVAVGSVCETSSSGCTAMAWISPDGRDWERSPVAGLGAGSASALGAADDRAAIVGRGPSSSLTWWLEPDGSSSQRAIPPARSDGLLTAASSDGWIVAAGAAGTEGGGVWLTSGDGWESYEDGSLGDATILGIAIDGDRIVAVGVIGGDPAGILVGRLEGFER